MNKNIFLFYFLKNKFLRILNIIFIFFIILNGLFIIQCGANANNDEINLYIYGYNFIENSEDSLLEITESNTYITQNYQNLNIIIIFKTASTSNGEVLYNLLINNTNLTMTILSLYIPNLTDYYVELNNSDVTLSGLGTSSIIPEYQLLEVITHKNTTMIESVYHYQYNLEISENMVQFYNIASLYGDINANKLEVELNSNTYVFNSTFPTANNQNDNYAVWENIPDNIEITFNIESVPIDETTTSSPSFGFIILIVAILLTLFNFKKD